MNTTDPIEFISRHRDTIFRWLGIFGVLLVVFLILRFIAMRMGGWRAAWRRVRRECAISGHAFAAPVRAWLRHRRSLRFLVWALGTTETWRDAERALAAARQAAAPVGGRPYAALVDADTVTVLLAGRRVPPPEEEPWWWDEAPDEWSVDRLDLPPVVPVPGQSPPVLVALGDTDRRCTFLDVATGPRLLDIVGDHRSRLALYQAVAAQLDARLPEGLAVVAEGVHAQIPGEPVRHAYRTAQRIRSRHGIAPALITAELPDPLPGELAEPPGDPAGPLIVLPGAARGYRRTLLTDQHGQVALAGTPLLAMSNALGRAIAQVAFAIPPALPPAPPGGEATGPEADRAFAELEDDDETWTETADEAGEVVPARQATRVHGPPVAESDLDEESEAEPVEEHEHAGHPGESAAFGLSPTSSAR
ncbi:hypothetical protein O7599_05755 [Streptomyces sp. WMMC500]|uniref:hypothetical protein n=1 Tax=Streptomyces sp. WMMC500 TaxID=3015154 RepID=UPI00248D332C|nr:hypothetical protein [Streptomyces sp. WMMC500]WBB62045.1 hypothetical protein O7599_05755 [Streptomyces sp. WMMC500]